MSFTKIRTTMAIFFVSVVMTSWSVSTYACPGGEKCEHCEAGQTAEKSDHKGVSHKGHAECKDHKKEECAKDCAKDCPHHKTKSKSAECPHHKS